MSLNPANLRELVVKALAGFWKFERGLEKVGAVPGMKPRAPRLISTALIDHARGFSDCVRRSAVAVQSDLIRAEPALVVRRVWPALIVNAKERQGGGKNAGRGESKSGEFH